MAEELEQYFVPIAYHVWWPIPNDPFFLYNSEECRARSDYYGNVFTPHLFVDGYIDAENNPDEWRDIIIQAADSLSPFEMDITGSFDYEDLSGEITVTIFAEVDHDASDLRLRIALTESSIYWVAPNGTVIHNHIFRDMIPSTNGEPIEIREGMTKVFTYAFETPDPLNPENCKFVAFVQADYDRRILQAARISIPELTPTGIDDNIEMSENLVLHQNYPNPFNAETRIDFYSAGGNVRLQVFDITGSLVETLIDDHIEAGYHSVIWDAGDIASGVYFYRLDGHGGQQVNRMTILK